MKLIRPLRLRQTNYKVGSRDGFSAEMAVRNMIHQIKPVGGDKLYRILMIKELRVDFLE